MNIEAHSVWSFHFKYSCSVTYDTASICGTAGLATSTGDLPTTEIPQC